jgi:hypothetical protein
VTSIDGAAQRALEQTPEWADFRGRRAAFEKRVKTVGRWIVLGNFVVLFAYMAVSLWWVESRGLGRAVSDDLALTFLMFAPGFVPGLIALAWWGRWQKRTPLRLTPSWEEETGVRRQREELQRRLEAEERERERYRASDDEPIRRWAPRRRYGGSASRHNGW